MDWRSHALIGAVSAPVLLFILGTHGLVELAAVAVMGAFAALVPDLDHQASKGRQVLDTCAIAAAFLVVYMSGCGTSICIPTLSAMQSMAVLSLAMLGAYFVFFTLFKPAHRGITHSLAACVAFATLAYFMFGTALAIAGLIGYASHLLADKEIKAI
ncbi:MAG: metal-dependent hydrolase [Candidatus ainarchaeum sp.]|nr:metal-dependent hydrolase [Candidatus ainarchaeum sp.]